MRRTMNVFAAVCAVTVTAAAASALYAHESGSTLGRSGMMGMMQMMGNMGSMMEGCGGMMQGMKDRQTERPNDQWRSTEPAKPETKR